MNDTTATDETFVLVHPETVPALYWAVDNDVYGEQVTAAAAGATRRIAVLDSYAVRDIAEAEADGEAYELTIGVEVEGWDVVPAEPGELDIAVKTIAAAVPPGTRITVGGFHREDCVRRVVEGLTDLGFETVVDDPSTLPPVGYDYDAHAERGCGNPDCC